MQHNQRALLCITANSTYMELWMSPAIHQLTQFKEHGLDQVAVLEMLLRLSYQTNWARFWVVTEEMLLLPEDDPKLTSHPSKFIAVLQTKCTVAGLGEILYKTPSQPVVVDSGKIFNKERRDPTTPGQIQLHLERIFFNRSTLLHSCGLLWYFVVWIFFNRSALLHRCELLWNLWSVKFLVNSRSKIGNYFDKKVPIPEIWHTACSGDRPAVEPRIQELQKR